MAAAPFLLRLRERDTPVAVSMPGHDRTATEVPLATDAPAAAIIDSATLEPTAAPEAEGRPPDEPAPSTPAPVGDRTRLSGSKPAKGETRPTPEAATSDDSAPSAANEPKSTRERAEIGVDFEHPLKSGTFQLWIDDELVIDEKLESRAKKIAVVKVRKGGLRKDVAVSAGEHYIRVRVAWDDNERSETLWGKLRPGETRHLEIRIGQLRKNLSLEWK
jgi:hypothetical protein